MELFKKDTVLADCDFGKGKFLGCSIGYRGDNIVPKDLCPAICSVKTKRLMTFVDWCPTGIKCGINYKPNTYFSNSDVPKAKKSVYLLANSTAIREAFERMLARSDQFYAGKEMVYQYLEDGLQ